MATYTETHKETIQASFRRFHHDNPHVYALIVKEAEKYFKKRTKFSVKEIVNHLRWNKYFVTEEKNLFEINGKQTRFKVNDVYIRCYSRLLTEQYPHMKDFVEQRTIRSV